MQERTPLRTPGANYISDLLWVGTSPSTSLVRNIAETLALEIVEGKVNPGYPMNSVHLSRRFRCSRTPVREALVALEREGLVTIPPRRRPYVSPITWRQARESYELRIHLLELVTGLSSRMQATMTCAGWRNTRRFWRSMLPPGTSTATSGTT